MVVLVLYSVGLGYCVGGWLKQYYLQYEVGFLFIMFVCNLCCLLMISFGCWFDVVVGLFGLCFEMVYEGQVVMELEGFVVVYGLVVLVFGGYVLCVGVFDFLLLVFILFNCCELVEGVVLFYVSVVVGLVEWVIVVFWVLGMGIVVVKGKMVDFMVDR